MTCIHIYKKDGQYYKCTTILQRYLHQVFNMHVGTLISTPGPYLLFPHVDFSLCIETELNSVKEMWD